MVFHCFVAFSQPSWGLELAVGTGKGNSNTSFVSLMEEGPIWKNHLASSQSCHLNFLGTISRSWVNISLPLQAIIFWFIWVPASSRNAENTVRWEAGLSAPSEAESNRNHVWGTCALAKPTACLGCYKAITKEQTRVCCFAGLVSQVMEELVFLLGLNA